MRTAVVVRVITSVDKTSVYFRPRLLQRLMLRLLLDVVLQTAIV